MYEIFTFKILSRWQITLLPVKKWELSNNRQIPCNCVRKMYNTYSWCGLIDFSMCPFLSIDLQCIVLSFLFHIDHSRWKEYKIKWLEKIICFVSDWKKKLSAFVLYEHFQSYCTYLMEKSCQSPFLFINFSTLFRLSALRIDNTGKAVWIQASFG